MSAGRALGSPHLHERTTASTNERAKRLAVRGAPHGTLVTAAEQTAGRGRHGRSWFAGPGDALLMSLVVRRLEGAGALLPLAAAVAVCEACEALSGAEARVKWPNDVWIDGRKAAGILIEGRPQEGWAVLGIGLNVRTRDFPGELAGSATSLALAGADVSLERALEVLLAELERWTAAAADTVRDAWRRRDALLAETIRWQHGAGVAAGIDDRGALLVERPDGSRTALEAGEVHLELPRAAH